MWLNSCLWWTLLQSLQKRCLACTAIDIGRSESSCRFILPFIWDIPITRETLDNKERHCMHILIEFGFSVPYSLLHTSRVCLAQEVAQVVYIIVWSWLSQWPLYTQYIGKQIELDITCPTCISKAGGLICI